MTQEQQEATELLTYSFDYPQVSESGSISICYNEVILQFPEKPTVFVESPVKIPRKFTLFIDNCNSFCTDWIPVYTWLDFHRVRDMIDKCLQSYSTLTENTTFLPHTFSHDSTTYFESLTSDYLTSNFCLNCYEHAWDTCVQLNVMNQEHLTKESPVHFKMCIGKHVVFSSERDLKGINQASDVHFIVQFILYKLSNFTKAVPFQWDRK